MNTLNPDITLRQREIIVGTVLGGSSIVRPGDGKNCYLSMRDRDTYWLEYKAVSLKELASDAPYTLPKRGSTFRWHSLCYPLFNEYHKMFYKNGERRLTSAVLDPLRDWGLAVWFIDCGKYVGNKVVLNTNIWGKKGTKIVVDYFRSLGYNVEVKLDRKGFRVWLDQEASLHFLEIVVAPLPIFVKKICGE
jgi:hypothetical protein